MRRLLPRGIQLVRRGLSFGVAIVTFAAACGVPAGRRAEAETVLVELGSATRYRSNASDPGLGTSWVAEGFDDSSWSTGNLGVGYDTGGLPNALALIGSSVPAGSWSAYTRSRFSLTDTASIANLFLGCDWDDGVVAWVNGVEVWRSPQMPAGTPAWNTNASLHESSNGSVPNYGSLVDVTATALPVLHAGVNVLAVGVWNSGAPGSSDLVVVPKLVMNVAGSVTSLTRGPYLQSGTPTSLRIRWRTSTPTDSRVRIGLDPSSLTTVIGAAPLVTEHDLLVSGLAAESTWYYSVGSSTQTLAGGDAGHLFRTPPPAGTSRPMRFWVLGDSGTANAAQARVRDAFLAWNGSHRVDAWIMLGDNAYSSGTDAEYQAGLFDVYPTMLAKSVLWPTLGNHDGISADSATQSGPYYDIFSLPKSGEAGGMPSGTEAYYSFDQGNIHFVCLESNETDRSPGGAMLTWLAADLAATSRDWVVAFWHHPPYSKGSHDSDTETQLVEMRQNALPILEAAGVDLVLTGHSHSYERSFFIDGHYGVSSTFNDSYKKQAGGGREAIDGAYRKSAVGPLSHSGAVYVVAGSSGQTSGGALNHPAMFVSADALGSMALDVDGNRLDAVMVDDSGVVRDRFTLIKGAGRTPRPVPDGAAVPGSAAKGAKLDAAGTKVRLSWDVSGCTPSTAYQLLHGVGSTLGAMVPAAAACGLGVAGLFDWDPLPLLPAGESLLWWTIVGSDSILKEGSWGRDSGGAEEGSGASGFCGTAVRDLSATCP